MKYANLLLDPTRISGRPATLRPTYSVGKISPGASKQRPTIAESTPTDAEHGDAITVNLENVVRRPRRGHSL